MAKNYYIILGISPDATLGQIRSAYRKRAKECHPGHLSQDLQTFLDILEAYDVLGNPGRRREYDRLRRESKVRLFTCAANVKSGVATKICWIREPFEGCSTLSIILAKAS